MKRLLLLLVPVTAALLLSCSGNPPVIEEMEWRVLLRDDGVDRREELALFLRIYDPDAPGDPVLVTVRTGDDGLIWRFGREDWVPERNGTEWWGMPAMVPLEGARLPDGRYTVRLEDMAGRSHELSFRPDPDRPRPGEITWPEASLENGILSLTGASAPVLLVPRDAEGTSLDSVPVADGSAVALEGAETWELWIPGVDFAGGYRLGPYPIAAGPADSAESAPAE